MIFCGGRPSLFPSSPLSQMAHVRGGNAPLSRHRHQLSFPVDIRLLWAGVRRLRGGYPKKECAEGESAGRRRGRQVGEEDSGPRKRTAGRGRGRQVGEEDSGPGKRTAGRGRGQRAGEEDGRPGKRTAGRGRGRQAGKENGRPGKRTAGRRKERQAGEKGSAPREKSARRKRRSGDGRGKRRAG